MKTPPPRDAARAVLLDEQDRVMLLRYDENGGFWATPGGKTEPGETRQQAVARELREELGVCGAAVGPCLATRVKDHLVAGKPVRQTEGYYLTRASADSVAAAAATQTDNIKEWRWWTIGELTATSETVYPAGLASLLSEVLASGPPTVPVSLT